MSWEYDKYLNKHIEYVKMGFEWIRNNILLSDLLEILPNAELLNAEVLIDVHDQSKFGFAEYSAYDEYFYGERTQEVKDNFNRAWLHHIHMNPHHWQHWVLIQDKGNAEQYYSGKIVALDMPDVHIIEMVCDWWSFSWKRYSESDPFEKNFELYEVFNWYDTNKNQIIFSPKTREKVERMLNLIHKTLDLQWDK